MTFMKQWFVVVGAVVVLGLWTAGVSAQDDQGDQKQDQKQQSESDKSGKGKEAQEGGQLTLKSFELKHIKPQEIVQLFQASTANSPGSPRTTAAGFGSAPLINSEAAPLGYGTLPGKQGKALRFAVDQDSNLLFVRGPEKEVKEIESIIQTFDAPPGEIKGTIQIGQKHMMAIDQKKSGRVASVLQQLGLASSTLQIGKTTLIVLPTKGEGRTQVEQVIEKLAQAQEDEDSESEKSEEGQEQQDDEE